MRVGHSIVPFKEATRLLGYDIVPYDINGFAKANEYSPFEFDICILMTDTGMTRMGWFTGCGYWGRRLKPEENVVLWKKSKDHYG